MSGPISSSEIEDVVASMRRLMSVDARPRPVSRDLAQDRLVLTPALRIVPEEVTESPVILTVTSNDRAADLQVPTPEPAQAMSPEPDMREAFEAEWEDEIWAEPEPPLAELALGIEEAELVPDLPPVDPVAETAADIVDLPDVEAPWAEVGDEWLDDLAGPADPIIAFVTASRAKAGKAVAASRQPSNPAAALADGVPADPAGARPAAQAVVEPPAADFAAVFAANEVVADAVMADAVMADLAPVQTQGETRPSVLELSAAELLTDAEGNPLTVLDEDALQQIIRQLIREELKGVLGERITQSVRKLVRAEINRALAAHALD